MKKREKTVEEVKYDELLKSVHEYLTDKYESITGFTNHKDFLACGFKDSDKERVKVRTYLSIPKEGQNKKVQSVPVLKTISEVLMKKKILHKIEVSRTSKIYYTN